MSQFTRDDNFQHDQSGFTGVLLTNLGSPDAPTAPALRRYLAEFLGDPRVVETPRWLWRLILHGIILRVRPAKSAKLYRAVWTDEGAPLIHISSRQLTGVEARLRATHSGNFRVAIAMRYGSPAISDVLERWRTAGLRRLVVLPLYPQYSATTTGTTFDAVADCLKQWRWVPELRFLNHYHDDPGYIAALADSIRQGRTERSHLLFSFHGLPQRYLQAGDPYFCHCQKTARLVAAALGLNESAWSVAFQSRFGREPWLQPYTGERLRELAVRGDRNVTVVCPGFAADCLETLEEIDTTYRREFMDAGGRSFTYVPALNDSAPHLEALSAILSTAAGDWLDRSDPDPALTRQQAVALGATR